MHHVTHPTKEQVRAYMLQRTAAHRPPPTPEEIRRLLGWSSGAPLWKIDCGLHALFLHVRLAQLTALLTLEWLFCASGVDRRY